MNLWRIVWSIIIGLIAFILALWVISLVAGTMAYGHLLAVLIGIVAGLATYFNGYWVRRGPVA